MRGHVKRVHQNVAHHEVMEKLKANSPDPPSISAHSTVTPALQMTCRLLRKSPYVATVHLPRATAEKRIEVLQERYPSVLSEHQTCSALRHLKLPAVKMLVMPPQGQQVTVFLLANVVPDNREVWTPALNPATPLTWKKYEVTTGGRMHEACRGYKPLEPLSKKQAERLTWRLSSEQREAYRQDITRLIHSHRAGPSDRSSSWGTGPKVIRTLPAIQTRLESLGVHLLRYPGFSGIRTDIWLLERHMQRLWQQQHPHLPCPHWPHPPYLSLLPAKLKPLSVLWAEIDAKGKSHD